METLIAKYESVLAEYRKYIIERMSLRDYHEYRGEVLSGEDSIEGDVRIAYGYVLTQLGKPLSLGLLTEIHRLCCGSIGDHEELIARVPQLLEATQAAMDKAETHPVCIAARFHCFFEHLHPFRDGNGRTGRLMANFILLSMGHPMVIIPSENKADYLLALQMYRKEHSVEYIEHFFLQTAIARMEREMAEKQANTARAQLRFVI